MKDTDIINKYPNIFKTKEKHTSSYIGFECREGWLPLIDNLCSKIEQVIKKDRIYNFKMVQVKSKFGALRIYTKGANQEILDLIYEAEAQSIGICSQTGEKINPK